MSKEEIWKDIKGYEGIYQVSSEGRVKSLERDIICKNGVKRHIKERIMKPHWFSKNGYPVYTLGNGINNNHYLHHLVGNAFIPNPEHAYKIRHKNKIKTDNRVENLYRVP